MLDFKEYKNKKFIILAILALLLTISIAFFLIRKDNTQDEENIATFDWSKLNYSRVSFFNATKDRASINIPEMWEGKYRITEAGDTVTFYYLNNDGTTEEMFGFLKMSNPQDGDKVVCQKGNLSFVLINYSFDASKKIENFNEGLNFIVKSLKCS